MNAVGSEKHRVVRPTDFGSGFRKFVFVLCICAQMGFCLLWAASYARPLYLDLSEESKRWATINVAKGAFVVCYATGHLPPDIGIRIAHGDFDVDYYYYRGLYALFFDARNTRRKYLAAARSHTERADWSESVGFMSDQLRDCKLRLTRMLVHVPTSPQSLGCFLRARIKPKPQLVVQLPMVLPAALFAAYPAVVLFGVLRRRRRRSGNRCVPCGYDLTGNESGRCPECGVQIGNR